MKRSDPVCRSVCRTLKRLSQTWDIPRLERDLDVTFSARLRSRLGRAIPSTGKIALHPELASGPRALLREVLCHEAAHVAVYWRHGPGVSPHGPEWAGLVERAGYKPLNRLRAELSIGYSPQTKRPRYEHLCTVCQAVRVARRRMFRWRCQACVEAGLSGQLQIQRLSE